MSDISYESWHLQKCADMLASAEKSAVSMVVEALKRQGYCVTSLRYRMASRIDREDWMTICPDADTYRRCHSKDNIVVSSSIMKKLKKSDRGYDKYRPLDKVKS